MIRKLFEILIFPRLIAFLFNKFTGRKREGRR